MEVVQLFRKLHPDLPPISQSSVSKIETHFLKFGHAKQPLLRHPIFVEYRRKSNVNDISQTTVLRWFNKVKLHSCKLQCVQ